MKKIHIILLLFCTSIFNNVHAQNVKVVDYLYMKDSISGLVPFDQHFKLRVSQLTNVSSFTLKIFEIKKYDYKRLLKRQGIRNSTEVNLELIKQNKGTLSFTSKEMKRGPGGNYQGDTCIVNVNAYLQPNSRYVFEIVGANETPITDDERDDVKTAIEGDANFQARLNDIIIANITAVKKNTKNWKPAIKDLSDIADIVIKSVNSKYVIREDINFGQKMVSAGKAFEKIDNIVKQVKEITERYKSPVGINFQNLVLLQNTSHAFITQLKNTDWASLEEADITSLERPLHTLITLDPNLPLPQKNNLAIIEGEVKDKIKAAIKAKDDFIKSFLELKEQQVFNSGSAASSYVPDFKERAKQHVTFDLGYAYIWGVDRANAYAGLNIYFRAVDTSLPLKNYRAGLIDYMGSHFSLLIGTSIESIQKDSVRRGLLGNGAALVTGIGYKLLPWFKINGGAYLYYKYPQNPLIDKNRLTFTGSPFISLSIDINLSSLFSSFGNGNIANIFKQ